MSMVVCLDKVTGRVKPMHAVNNGPVFSPRGVGNKEDFAAAGIPYARNHDASFCSAYGGYHTVDVPVVFPDFDADPDDPASYDFPCTDKYVSETFSVGVKMFYRLGTKIEHEVKKYNIHPPKDNRKWAVICEHIIRHYTEGWADGFRFDLEYWEIWNEPDLDLCWSGTKERFFELYEEAATYLKARFPHLKIGGPALTHSPGEYAEAFLSRMKERNVPIDFFSWHWYSTDPRSVRKDATLTREMLDRHGYTETENILDEWNYVRGWTGDDILYSMRTIASMKGAAFTAAVMCEGQAAPLDMLMYYDARPTPWNGLFDERTFDRLKGYYPFPMFDALYRLGNDCRVTVDEPDLYAIAATSDDRRKSAVLISTFLDDEPDGSATRQSFCIRGLPDKAKIVFRLLDKTHDCEIVREAVAGGGEYRTFLELERNAVMLIEAESV